MELLIGVFVGGIIAAGVVAILAGIIAEDMKLTTLSIVAAVLFAIGWVCESYYITEIAYAMLGIGAVPLVLVAVLWHINKREVRDISTKKLQEKMVQLEKGVETVKNGVTDAKTNAKEIDSKIEALEAEGKRYVPEVR